MTWHVLATSTSTAYSGAGFSYTNKSIHNFIKKTESEANEYQEIELDFKATFISTPHIDIYKTKDSVNSFERR